VGQLRSPFAPPSASATPLADLVSACAPPVVLQSALTGESLPVTKEAGDCVYSGSTCKQGELDAVVIATGVHTFFGKAAHLVDSTHNEGHFQKVSASFCPAHALHARSWRPGIPRIGPLAAFALRLCCGSVKLWGHRLGLHCVA